MHRIEGQYKYKMIPESEAFSVVNNMPETVSSGMVYIDDPEFVHKCDLDEIYRHILSATKLKELLKHFSVEGIILSQATLDVSPSREREFKACFPPELPCQVVGHPHFRDELTRQVKFAIRTGDFTANSNIILISAGGPRWYCEKS